MKFLISVDSLGTNYDIESTNSKKNLKFKCFKSKGGGGVFSSRLK